MQVIGILAAIDEWAENVGRVRTTLHRYGMLRTLYPHYISTHGVGAAVYYLRYTISELYTLSTPMLARVLAQAENAFARSGIRYVLRTQPLREALGQRLRFNRVTLCDGKGVMSELAPQLLRELSAQARTPLADSTVAIIDDDMNRGVASTEALCGDCRYITIITKNTRRAEHLADRMLDTYGIPIHVTDDHRIDAAFAIIHSGGAQYSAGCLVIDATGGGVGSHAYRWAALDVRHDCPFGFDSLELTEALTRCGVRIKPRIAEIKK